MKKTVICIILAMVALTVPVTLYLYLKIENEFRKLESDDPTVWESVISDFEEEDRVNPPPLNAVLFVGSSSIRFWFGLEKDFSGLPVIKRGFGGAKLKDIVYYADRIIYKYHPRIIVIFAGTNDISGRPNDKTPEQAFMAFKVLAEGIRKKLPDAKLIYLPVTPTTARWRIWPQARKLNDLIRDYMRQIPDMTYLDIQGLFLNNSGVPEKSLLWLDGVHLNSRGYEVWKKALLPEILTKFKPIDGQESSEAD